jgi:N-acetylmuramoyl-L-alanine amidase
MDLESDFTNILFLSIHTNSNPSSSLHGTQVYYVTDESIIASEDKTLDEDSSYLDNPNYPIRQDYYGRDGTRNELLAQALYESIIEAVPSMESNASSTIADNYAVLRENSLTGVLIEVGFISNKEDRSYLTDESTIADIADGIADGCINYFVENP